MNTGYFLTQDQDGNCYRVFFDRDEHGSDTAGSTATPRRYTLEDGSQLQRIDNETFKLLRTGAYVSLVHE